LSTDQIAEEPPYIDNDDLMPVNKQIAK